MALRSRNASLIGRAFFNPQSTCHGPRTGPNLAYGVRAGYLCGTDRAERPEEGKMPKGEKNTLIYIYKDRAAPPIGGLALHDSGVKTVQWRKRECHDSYQEVEVYLVHNIYYIYMCSLCDKY